ncbi:MAG: YiaA/YiaB family inner membrane protein [Acidimicrobiales bacterium]
MTNIQPTSTTAFYAQATISFAVSFGAVLLGVAYIPGNGWMRAFMAMSLLYVVTSAFTLAKCIRDQQEQSRVVHRVDEVRLEKLLAEHDPYKSLA